MILPIWKFLNLTVYLEVFLQSMHRVLVLDSYIIFQITNSQMMDILVFFSILLLKTIS